MKKFLHILLLNLIPLLGYTQVSQNKDSSDRICYTKTELQQILYTLIEGEKNKELVNSYIKIIADQEEVIKLQKEKDSLSLETIHNLKDESNKHYENFVKVNEQYNKEIKRKKTWRTVAISSTGILAVILTTVLLIK